jgi:hypothetical protein
MERTTQADGSLPADRMSEAEVALRLADHLLSLPGSGSMASVAINGASVRVGDSITFDIGRFLARTGWDRTKARPVGRTAWTGACSRGEKTIRVHSRPGEGDVIAHVNGRRIVAKCKKGPLIRKAGSPEYPLLIMALDKRFCSMSQAMMSWSQPFRTRPFSGRLRINGGAVRLSESSASRSLSCPETVPLRV